MRSRFSRILSPRSRTTTALALVLTGLAGGASACPDWRQTGQQISVSADQLWSPQSFTIRAGGAHNLANCPVPARGYADTQPHFDLSLTDNSAQRELHVSVVADCDTVLLINDARAQWNFNDDHDGLNPRIVLPNAPAGVYDIWVGTYSPTPCLATVTFETMGGSRLPQQPARPAACPEPGRNGQMLGLSFEQLRRTQRYGLTSGAALDLGACASVPGQGRIAQWPDFTLSLTGSAPGATLELRAESGCDPVLLINDPQGRWHFNDDADGLNSRLTLPAEPGLYDLWIGSYGGTSCAASLVATKLGGQAQPAPQPQPQPLPQPATDGLVWRFQSDPQGWTARDAALSMAPGSHMQITAWGDSRVGYLIAPPAALGDWRGVTGIEAVMRTPGARYFDAFTEGGVGDLVIWNGTMTAAARFPHWLGPDWARVEVPLREAVTLGGTRLWQLGGGARSLDEVLANVTAFHVRGEFRLGDTTADVSEIAIRGRIVPAAGVVTQPGAARFVLVETAGRITFDDARQRAAAMGGHLATITSAAEMEALRAVVSGRTVFGSGAGPWLGGVRTGTGSAAEGWTWITGEPWVYTAWARNEPNYFRDASLTALSLTDRDGVAWNDEPPYGAVTSFVVEFPGVPLGVPALAPGVAPVPSPGLRK